jgi:hypothetical protein
MVEEKEKITNEIQEAQKKVEEEGESRERGIKRTRGKE